MIDNFLKGMLSLQFRQISPLEKSEGVLSSVITIKFWWWGGGDPLKKISKSKTCGLNKTRAKIWLN